MFIQPILTGLDVHFWHRNKVEFNWIAWRRSRPFADVRATYALLQRGPCFQTFAAGASPKNSSMSPIRTNRTFAAPTPKTALNDKRLVRFNMPNRLAPHAVNQEHDYFQHSRGFVGCVPSSARYLLHVCQTVPACRCNRRWVLLVRSSDVGNLPETFFVASRVLKRCAGTASWFCGS